MFINADSGAALQPYLLYCVISIAVKVTKARHKLYQIKGQNDRNMDLASPPADF